MLPQLRVRTGYTFRDAYGKLPDVIERLNKIECSAAGIVDAGTWGHCRFEQAMLDADKTPMFGAEIPLELDDPLLGVSRPRAWVLAEDTRAFYRLSSLAAQRGTLTLDDMQAAQGVLRFAGGALAGCYAGAFDYIDVNPSSVLHAAQAAETARQTGLPMVLTSYNDIPDIEHASAAYSWEVRQSVGVRHIATEAEIWDVLQYTMTPQEFASAWINTCEVAERLQNVRLAKAPTIHAEGDLVALCEKGKAYRVNKRHIKEWTPEYEQRLQLELDVIKSKDFDSYFLCVIDLVQYAKQHMLVGPARGSSAGSLVCYLTQITEIDPIKHKLLFYRFCDPNRNDLPDVDIDFSDTKRHLIFEYLQNKYGIEHVCKLGNINTLKALSVIAQVGKRFNLHINETQPLRYSLVEYWPGDKRYGLGMLDTFETTDSGQTFRANHPDAARCMAAIEIHPAHSSVHAAGILLCNEPVSHYCTVNGEGIAQIDKPDAEYLNFLKIDALGLRTLGIIEDTGVTAETLYALELNDPNVLDILNEGKVSGVFQFEGDALRAITKAVKIDSFSRIDHLTSLARPGPLNSGMAKRYVNRAAGEEPVSFEVPQLEPFLNQTYGVILYQEQIMEIVRNIGRFDWSRTSAIRKAMGSRKGQEFFDQHFPDFEKGAKESGLTTEQAQKIWSEMIEFGVYCFNRSHSVAYAVVTYWTLWLKRYHMLEYAAACLRAAKDDAQTVAILREMLREGINYTALDPALSDMNWQVADGRLLGGIMNAKGFGPVTAMKFIDARTHRTESEKTQLAYDRMFLRLADAEIKFADLNEAHTRYGHYYAEPALAGVESGRPIIGMSEAPDNTECLVIGKLVSKKILDENEPFRLKQRGTRYHGPSQFLDMYLIDDSSDTTMKFRIRPELYSLKGKDIAANAPVNTWFLVKAKKVSGYSTFIVKNLKQLE